MCVCDVKVFVLIKAFDSWTHVTDADKMTKVKLIEVNTYAQNDHSSKVTTVLH